MHQERVASLQSSINAMPNAIVLPLQRMNNAPLPAAAGEYTHAAFFDLISRADPALAARLHDSVDRKPFTLSAVREARAERGRSGGEALLRVTFLDDTLFPLFAGALLTGGLQEGLRIAEARFLLTGLLTTEGTHPLAGHAHYADLQAQAGDAETVSLRFASPTAFRSQGKDALFPEPRHVWQSWLRAWNAHAASARSEPKAADTPPLTLDEQSLIELVGAKVTVERYKLETYKVTLKEGAQSGFVGTCVYNLRGLEPPDRQTLNMLADFAFYAGTGRKTAMGMGQTLRLENVRP